MRRLKRKLPPNHPSAVLKGLYLVEKGITEEDFINKVGGLNGKLSRFMKSEIPVDDE